MTDGRHNFERKKNVKHFSKEFCVVSLEKIYIHDYSD